MNVSFTGPLFSLLCMERGPSFLFSFLFSFAYINLVILLFKEPEEMRMSLYRESSFKMEDSESTVFMKEKTIAVIRLYDHLCAGSVIKASESLFLLLDYSVAGLRLQIIYSLLNKLGNSACCSKTLFERIWLRAHDYVQSTFPFRRAQNVVPLPLLSSRRPRNSDERSRHGRLRGLWIASSRSLLLCRRLSCPLNNHKSANQSQK